MIFKCSLDAGEKHLYLEFYIINIVFNWMLINLKACSIENQNIYRRHSGKIKEANLFNTRKRGTLSLTLLLNCY